MLCAGGMLALAPADPNAPPLRRHTEINPSGGPAAAAAAAIVANAGGVDFSHGARNSVPAGLTGYDAEVAPQLSDLEQW